MSDQNWTEIGCNSFKRKSAFKELFEQKDLILLLVRRDFAKEFKQTILGPVWFVAQPVFQTLILVFVFGKIGRMGPEGIPMVSFYLLGIMLWITFSENLIKTSETFRTNAAMFGKVYFARLVMPVSSMLTIFLKIIIQLVVFIIVYFYELTGSENIHPHFSLIFLPVYFLIASTTGMGVGLIICSMTTKYWDLRFVVQFAMQLLMFMSAVITPVSSLHAGWMKSIILLNPISSLIEGIRFSFLGPNGGTLDLFWFSYSILFCLFSLIIGIWIFRRVESSFIDTV